MRVLLAAALIVLIATGAWNAGEMHKRNCEQAGKVECGVLPWDGGRPPDRTFDVTTAR